MRSRIGLKTKSRSVSNPELRIDQIRISHFQSFPDVVEIILKIQPELCLQPEILGGRNYEK